MTVIIPKLHPLAPHTEAEAVPRSDGSARLRRGADV
jgi:hypothetical protein